MKKLRLLSIVGLFIVSLFIMNSCSDKDDGYSGNNEVYITAEGSSILIVGEEKQEVNAKLTLTQKVDKATTLKLKITNQTGAVEELVKVVSENLTIAAGERSVDFKIVLKDKASVVEEQRIQINIENKGLIIAKKELIITVKPALNIQKLTDEQKKLLTIYKTKGMDIVPFLGKQKVKTTIIYPKDGSLAGLDKPFTKSIEGTTVIALSKNSTAEQPVLEMTENPMGVEEFFYKLLRKETIENEVYWYGEYAGPDYAKVMKLINWNKKSKEVFTATLSGIKVKMPKNEISQIEYLGDGKDSYGSPIKVVPFKFSYTAWDRLKKLIDANNKDAIQYHKHGATPFPGNFINNTSVSSCGYDDNSVFKKSTASINYKTGKMVFDFLTSHTQGGNYIIVKAEYGIK